MCSNLCALLPKHKTERGQEECKKGGDEKCKHSDTLKCYQYADVFTGGSKPWKGTVQQQKEAAIRAAAEAECLEPPCRWYRCARASCPAYSCSGLYQLKEFRPTCEDIIKPPDKAWKQQWCWTPEASILTHCNPCPPPRYFCPEEVKIETCPHKFEESIPLFRWKYGIPYPNISREPYPHLLEGLNWKKPPPLKSRLQRNTDLWAVGCSSVIENELTNKPCKPPSCPGHFVREKPLFIWHDGYGKENHSQDLYPGRGTELFDPCKSRMESRKSRDCGTSQPHFTSEQKSDCGCVGTRIGNALCDHDYALCASVAKSTATPP